MDNNRKTWINIISYILIVLWGYTSVAKLSVFATFKQQMANQHFPESVTAILIYFLPAVELFILMLLLLKSTLKTGLLLSTVMLAIFTGYVIVTLSGMRNSVPCSCGGVLEFLGWKWHLVFNLFFLLLNLWAIRLFTKHGKEVGKIINQ